jgi:hypothetical protein
MDTALELGAGSARKDCASGCWTNCRSTRRHKYVGWARGLGNELTECTCGAFWRRNWITGRRVERRNEAAAKIFHLRKGVRLPASVLQFQNGSLIERSSGWIEMPGADLLSRRQLLAEVVKRDVSVSDASSRSEHSVEGRRIALVPHSHHHWVTGRSQDDGTCRRNHHKRRRKIQSPSIHVSPPFLQNATRDFGPQRMPTVIETYVTGEKDLSSARLQSAIPLSSRTRGILPAAHAEGVA